MLGEEKPGVHGLGSTVSVAGRRWTLGLCPLSLAPSPVRAVAFLPRYKGERERGREET